MATPSSPTAAAIQDKIIPGWDAVISDTIEQWKADPEIGKLGDFDSVSVILSTASGRQAVITNSRRATYGYDQRIEVHGSAGMVTAENQRPVSIEVANAFAKNVLPVPGGPTSSTPRGMRAPRAENFSGYLRNSTTSWSSASSGCRPTSIARVNS